LKKIYPIALFTALAVAAAGTFGFVATHPNLTPQISVAKIEPAPAVTPAQPVPNVATAPAAPVAEVKKPEQQIVSATSNTMKIELAPKPGAANLPSFDTVHVGRSGDAVIAGRAAPGTDVVAKLNGKVIATAKANDAGSFVMIPDQPLPAGAGKLSLETSIDGTTQVSAATVTVDVKLQAPVTASEKVVVAAAHATPPAAAPDVPAPVTQVPVVAAPAPTTPDEPIATATTSKPDGPKTLHIVVQSGNSLWNLSRDLYGQGQDYPVIYDANRELIRDPNLIYPGQIITAPPMQGKKP
jgi:nucleoid-associated protein YgaU